MIEGDQDCARFWPARALRIALLAVSTALLVGCHDGGTWPTSRMGSELMLDSATLSVAGQVVNGMTLPPGHGRGTSTRFEARLSDAQGAPLPGHTVRVRFQRPSGMGMMGSSGTMMLYDDGTHGDHVPGDGTYCYEDFSGDYGCHAQSSPMGEYHYEFWGEDHDGGHSNHMSVTVTLG